MTCVMCVTEYSNKVKGKCNVKTKLRVKVCDTYVFSQGALATNPFARVPARRLVPESEYEYIVPVTH